MQIFKMREAQLEQLSLVFAAKAYVGAAGEGGRLFRPIKKCEKPYKTDEADSITFNKDLNKVQVKRGHVFARLKTFRVLQGHFAWKSSGHGEIIKADDVSQHKPDPMSYLISAQVATQKYGLCEHYAVEDSATGLKAALAAHMNAIHFLPAGLPSSTQLGVFSAQTAKNISEYILKLSR